MSYGIFRKKNNFFECFMDIPDFKTCKMIKIEFNKQIMDRCDSKIDFRGYNGLIYGGANSPTLASKS